MARDARGRFTSTRRVRRATPSAFPSRRLFGPRPTGDEVLGVVTGETVTLGATESAKEPKSAKESTSAKS